MPDVAAHRDFYARGGYCEGYDEGGAVDSIGEPEDPLAFAGGGSVDDDMLAYDSQYYAEGGNVDAGEDDRGKGRFTYSPAALRKFREQTAFENALAYALRDMPDPKSVPYMRGVGSVSVASPFDRIEPASHDYASGGSVDDDFDTEYMSQYFEEGGSVPPWMKAR